MHFHRLTSATDPAFFVLLRIYTESFPASERKPLPVLHDMLARPDYHFLIAAENEAILGFSISIALPGSDAALCEYMAVDARSRARGLGPLLFRATAAQPEMKDRFILIEVDAESPNRERLKHFYRRLGCRQVAGLTYLMPRVAIADPPRMDLLVYRQELPAVIEKPRLRVWLESVDTQVYGQPASDPRIALMLATLPDSIPLN